MHDTQRTHVVNLLQFFKRRFYVEHSFTVQAHSYKVGTAQEVGSYSATYLMKTQRVVFSLNSV